MKSFSLLSAILLTVSVFSVLLSAGCVQEEGSAPGTEISMEEVSGHSSVNDCWIVINGEVYDVTGFITSHPGGNAILEGCGKNATTLFETRPMGSGTSHSTRARGLLANYHVGKLKG